MFVAKPLRFAEPDAVNDRRVIQFVADHGVFRAEQRFKQAAVGVEADGIKDRVFGPEKFGQAASSSLWMSCVPQIKRTDAMPKP